MRFDLRHGDCVVAVVVGHAERTVVLVDELVVVNVLAVLARIDGLVRWRERYVPAINGALAAGVVAGVLPPTFKGPDGGGGTGDCGGG